MTYQTLKYYCNEGLVPGVNRDNNNRRVFDEKDVKWIKDLTCLKKCGMSIQEMKAYLELCQQGESTIIPRKEMLAIPASTFICQIPRRSRVYTSKNLANETARGYKKQEALRISIKEIEDSVT